ncbi:pyridoxamine 5'-phosphate oxidase family protein [Citrobacter sp. Res13-Sevr-PEB04-36]|uniref:pyridoxamine 5'-phosphate oxidase family protein n=1 Tax=Citrobacter sp. Res13-Sevr-PEB04-36 TaxID=2777960 RepID=UPI0018ACAEBB|nr:pyridoxamine 5'-phosphate oxidase family protein [Citrobacter sp. Res13-Sevr-PEB04-36]
MGNPERIISNPDDILTIIKTHQICRIALNNESHPYIVPVNFGYEYMGDRWTIWFHGARTGKKMRLLRKNSAISVELDGDHRLIEAENACDYSYAYTSIIASGEATIVQDRKEMEHGLDVIMRQAAPGRSFSYRDDMIKAVCVVRIDCQTLTCRRHAVT